MMRIGVVALLGVLGASASARADRLTDPIEAPAARSMRAQVTKKLGELGNEVGFHLGRLSFALLDLDVDPEERRAALKIGGGQAEKLRMRLDGDVSFEHGYARIDARLDLSLAGKDFELELPTFDMVPRSLDGKQFIELRLPLLRGAF